jgi:hypothetical protein
MEYVYTLNLQAQSNTLDDLLHTMDEVKEQIAAGYAMANDKKEHRRYALSINKEESGKNGSGNRFAS